MNDKDKIETAIQILMSFHETAGWFGRVAENYSFVQDEQGGTGGINLLNRELSADLDDSIAAVLLFYLHEGWHAAQYDACKVLRDTQLFYQELDKSRPSFKPSRILRPYDFFLAHTIYNEMAAYAATVDLGHRLYMHTDNQEIAQALKHVTGELYDRYLEILSADELPDNLIYARLGDKGEAGEPHSDKRRAFARAAAGYEWYLRKEWGGEDYLLQALEQVNHGLGFLKSSASTGRLPHFNAIAGGKVNFQPLTRGVIQSLDGYSGPSIFSAGGVMDYMSPVFHELLEIEDRERLISSINHQLNIAAPQAA